MVANALWGWLQQWKQNIWQHRGRPIWAAAFWQYIAARVENLAVKVCHVDAHVPKSQATEEHQNNQQVDQAAKIEVAQVDLDWQHKGELFIAHWAHDTSGHQGRDATYRWACDRGVDLTMDTIAQVIHECETCAAIKQAKQLKPLWYGGRWLKYQYGEAWQINYITLPQTRQGKRHVLTVVEAAIGWLETYPVPHATAWNTILGLGKQVLWRLGTPERIESGNGTHCRNNLIDTWAKEHGIEWVYHIPYHAPASGKLERYNGLLKATLRAMGGGTFKHWATHLAKATCRHPSEQIISWLLRCWDTGDNSKEAWQLGSLARDKAIDKGIGKGATVLSLWRRLLSSVKERHPLKEDLANSRSKWTTIEGGIQYLRELAMVEVIYSNLDNNQASKDLNEIWCMRSTWRKFVQSAPTSYTNTLAIMSWTDTEAPTVDGLARQL
ncbi:hypothetical protein QYF61_012600 [Mycteria americana]|uniref:Integrase catalytic domain-containing protein n=1 Tax=Mycteria americana TaxID=33587 RepID=A0AAN7MJG6_MYCAM|nr:hypothetical protein QYF61_012600 [Mycteria americana]